MSSIRKRGRVWYYRFVDADGVRHERKGCPDRRETESMAAAAESEAAKVQAGLIDSKALAFRAHEARPLADHLADFRAALLAKGGTRKHALVSSNRAGRVLTLPRARCISDLSPSKALGALAILRSEGLGPETINHHVRAVKAYSRWLWKDGLAREHYLAHLATVNPDADRRRRRRALTVAEAIRLVQAAERGPVVMGMTGPDRARCYALALGTGFRAAELASLTPERFDLAGDPPTVTVAACYAKNGREAVQPLPPALADRLAPWLSSLAPGRPVFPLPERTAEMIRVDLTAAGIEYEAPSGVVDFHALRGCYISYLVSSGASVKTCQTLARHSTPSLTIGIYAKASLHDITGAVGSLPDLTTPSPKPEATAATGTDGRHIGKLFAPPLPLSGDGTGRELSVVGGNEHESESSNALPDMVHNPLKNRDLDGPMRVLSAPVVECRRWESNPHGSSPPEDFKSSASAVPPRRLGGWVPSCSATLTGVKKPARVGTTCDRGHRRAAAWDTIGAVWRREGGFGPETHEALKRFVAPIAGVEGVDGMLWTLG